MSDPLSIRGNSWLARAPNSGEARPVGSGTRDDSPRGRPNGSGDDGDTVSISVSARMRARLEGLKQTAENLRQSSQMLSVADVNLDSIQNQLFRIRQLAVQSANGTLNANDRQILQVHVSQLVDEVDRIASQADFNGHQLLLGNFARGSRVASLWFQVGPGQHDRERAYIGTNTAGALGLRASWGGIISLSTTAMASDAIGVMDFAIARVAKQRGDLKAYAERIESLRSLQADSIRILEQGVAPDPDEAAPYKPSGAARP